MSEQNKPQGSVKNDSEGKRILSEFITEDLHDIKEYLIFDVMIPAAKNAISDLVSGGIDMMLFGGSRSSGSRTGNTNYTRFSSNRGSQRVISCGGTSGGSVGNRISSNGYRIKDITINTRAKAEVIVDDLIAALNKYDAVSVADYYDICSNELQLQIDSEFTDNQHGWTNLNGIRVERAGGGFFIRLPRIEDL